MQGQSHLPGSHSFPSSTRRPGASGLSLLPCRVSPAALLRDESPTTRITQAECRGLHQGPGSPVRSMASTSFTSSGGATSGGENCSGRSGSVRPGRRGQHVGRIPRRTPAPFLACCISAGAAPGRTQLRQGPGIWTTSPGKQGPVAEGGRTKLVANRFLGQDKSHHLRPSIVV